MSISRI
jgi:hypothetical protein